MSDFDFDEPSEPIPLSQRKRTGPSGGLILGGLATLLSLVMGGIGLALHLEARAEKRAREAEERRREKEKERSADFEAQLKIESFERQIREINRDLQEHDRETAVRRQEEKAERLKTFLIWTGTLGNDREAAARQRFLRLKPQDQETAVRVAKLLNTGGTEALTGDTVKKEAAFFRAHPELFPAGP